MSSIESLKNIALQTVQNGGYIWIKKLIEISASIYRHNLGQNIIIVRPGSVYGPRDYGVGEKRRLIPALINNVLTKEKINLINSNFSKSLLYISDFIRIMLEVIAREENITVNITGKEEKIERIIEIIEKNTGIKANVSKLYEAKESIIISENISDYQNVVGDFPLTDIEKGIYETVKFYRGINNEKY